MSSVVKLAKNAINAIGTLLSANPDNTVAEEIVQEEILINDVFSATENYYGLDLDLNLDTNTY